jgi:hypothetical protein
MPRHGGATHGETLGDLAHASFAIEEHVENRAARRVGNGAEDGG